MARAVFRVEGMSCGNCVKHVSKAISALPSVSDAKVEIGRVELTHDPAQLSIEHIAKALEDAGYTSTVE